MFPPGKCCILINGCFGMKPVFFMSHFFLYGYLAPDSLLELLPLMLLIPGPTLCMSSGIGFAGSSSVERIGHRGPKLLFWLSMGEDVLMKAQTFKTLLPPPSAAVDMKL